MKSSIKNFVFTGLMAKHAISDLQARGLLHIPESPESDKQRKDVFVPIQEEIRNSSLQMQHAYRILYVLENMIRYLIESRLSEAYGANWFAKRATEQMKKKIQKRKYSDEKNLWHAGRKRSPLHLLDFGDLKNLIVGNWGDFEDLLPDQAWVSSRLDEAEKSRHVIAHTNILSPREINRLEMYLEDWIKQIG